MEEKNHIYPIFDRMMTRQDKEELLGQHSVMIWFTGLSGSGKSTIAYTVMGMYGMTGGEIDFEGEVFTSWMGIISVVELIITWDSPKRTGWKIFVV